MNLRPFASVETENWNSLSGRRSAARTLFRLGLSRQKRLVSGSKSFSVPGKTSRFVRRNSQRGLEVSWPKLCPTEIGIKKKSKTVFRRFRQFLTFVQTVLLVISETSLGSGCLVGC